MSWAAALATASAAPMARRVGPLVQHHAMPGRQPTPTWGLLRRLMDSRGRIGYLGGADRDCGQSIAELRRSLLGSGLTLCDAKVET
jgi:hypothetical protein